MTTSIAIRKPLRLGVLMLLSAALGTASATTALAAAPAARQQAVPWAQAGVGWTVVQYSTGTQVPGHPSQDKVGRQTLYLVSPQGKKYAFYSWKTSGPVPYLIDWSGDRQRVLLKTQPDYTAAAVLEQVSLVTGKVIGKFTLPREMFPIGYTKPDGLNLLAVTESGKLIRYDLQGHQQKVLGQADKADISALYTPDGTAVIAGIARGLEEVSNVGGIIKRLPAPASYSYCAPVRWWKAGTVLATCFTKRGPQRLWLFNFGTGRVTALTSASIPVAEDGGWPLGGKLYLNVAAGCQFIDQVNRGNSVHRVRVPGSPSAIIVGSVAGRLLVLGSRQCYYADKSLLSYNPATHAVKYVFNPTGNTIGVISAAPFGQPPTL
jgi:hypothetical protein